MALLPDGAYTFTSLAWPKCTIQLSGDPVVGTNRGTQAWIVVNQVRDEVTLQNGTFFDYFAYPADDPPESGTLLVGKDVSFNWVVTRVGGPAGPVYFATRDGKYIWRLNAGNADTQIVLAPFTKSRHVLEIPATSLFLAAFTTVPELLNGSYIFTSVAYPNSTIQLRADGGYVIGANTPAQRWSVANQSGYYEATVRNDTFRDNYVWVPGTQAGTPLVGKHDPFNWLVKRVGGPGSAVYFTSISAQGIWKLEGNAFGSLLVLSEYNSTQDIPLESQFIAWELLPQ